MRCGIIDVFSKNRERLLEGDIAAKFLRRGAGAAAGQTAASLGSFLGRRHAGRGLGVNEEFSTEGRYGRCRRRPATGRNARGGFPWSEALATRRMPRRPIRKPDFIARDRAWKPSSAFIGHALDGEPYGLVVDACLTPANGHAERIAALAHDRAARRPTGRRSRSAPTRATTPPTSSTSCAP